MDFSFRNSRYYVKVTRSRTLITPFGIITYTRTVYSFKDDSIGTYCYLDSLLGIPKYDRYNPCVKAMMVDYYADSNSILNTVNAMFSNTLYHFLSIIWCRIFILFIVFKIFIVTVLSMILKI
ncbi:UPF0236 family transposase-like protein [Breznakia pachnodae]|uniref:UPF0236 family transposase-like protein n=1 Tax=Breznakia pachnodae TaxID=265178 RepID=UPI00352188C1